MGTRYLIRRVAQSLIVLLAVLVLVFFVTHLLGDPVSIALPPNSSEVQIQAVRVRLGLDQPLHVQFTEFMTGALTGSFGESFWQSQPALPLVIERIPATVYLGLVAFALIVPIGLGMGILAALRPRSWIERLVNLLSFVSVSIVDFWLALMLIVIFSVGLRVLPTSGYGGIEYVILPATTLALLASGSLAQVTRASVAEELRKSYVASARARGIPERRVVLRHALRNAAIPIVTLCGGILISLLNGAIIAEVVFGWPGVGLLLTQAIQKRDLPLIEATVFVTAVMVAVMNLLVDLLYGAINPRARVA